MNGSKFADGTAQKKIHLPQGPLQWGIFAAAAVLLVTLVAVCIWQSTRDQAPSAAEMSEPVIVCGDFSMSNTQLNYYFWSAYFYLTGNYSQYLPESLDTAKPLSEQMYDEERTWEDYLLEQTMQTIRDTMVMVFEAEKAGFQMPETYEDSLASVLERFEEYAEAAGYTKEDGTVDLETYLTDSYGPGATTESFSAYMQDSYLAAAYSDALYLEPTFTEEEISDYYDLYAEDYAADGVAKDDTRLRNLRTVVIRPAENTEEAWAQAESSARTLLATWEAESGAEADFAALAQAHSSGATAADGGLAEKLAPSDLTEEFAAWAFEEARQAGDTTVVQTDEGWTIAYYVGEASGTVWQKAAEEDLRQQTYQDAFRTACDQYSFQVDYDAICIVAPVGLYESKELSLHWELKHLAPYDKINHMPQAQIENE